MEHVVQFGINIDDTAITEAIKRDAYKEVIKQLTDEACKKMDIIFDGLGGGGDGRA